MPTRAPRSTPALAAWAWEELTDGTNGLRRAFGAAGFGYVIVKVGQALGA